MTNVAPDKAGGLMSAFVAAAFGYLAYTQADSGVALMAVMTGTIAAANVVDSARKLSGKCVEAFEIARDGLATGAMCVGTVATVRQDQPVWASVFGVLAVGVGALTARRIYKAVNGPKVG